MRTWLRCATRSRWVVAGMVTGACVLVGTAREARADDASVSVGDPDALHSRFAPPPPGGDGPIVTDPPPPPPSDPDRPIYVEPDAPREYYRAPVRLQLGPVGVTTGRGLGMGLGAAADFGTGTVGARISAAWTRGELHDDGAAQVAELGSGLAQYTGELTLDFHKRGPVHPVFGMGFGLAHVSHPQGSGNAGIGTVRLGLEYALGLEDADVRLGAGVTGALAGPSEREADALHGYALVGGTLAIGF